MTRHAPRQFFLIVTLILSVVLSGCGTPTPPPPTATPTATPTPEPTATPTPLPLAAWVTEGEAALARSDFAGAEAAYQRAIDADPGYAAAYIGLAWAYGWQLNRQAEALTAAQKAAELAPEDAAAWAVLAHVNYRREQVAAAVEAGEKAVALDPANATAQAALARAYSSDAQYDAALKAAVEAVKLEPGSAYAYTSLAVVYEWMADYGRAQAAAEKAINLQPEFAQWRVHLADLHDTRLHEEAAAEGYEKALALAPDHPQALLGLADLQIAKREYAKAEELISQAAQIAPSAADPLISWGYLYLEQEEFEKANAKFKAAAELKPGAWGPVAAQADVRLRQGDCESAASMAQDLIASHPRVAALRLVGAWAKWCLGDTARSLELTREAVKLNPYSSEAHWLQGMLLAGQERWSDAVASHLTAARYAGAPVAAHNALGELFMSQNEIEKGEAEYTLAAALDPNDASAPRGLCTANWYINEFEEMAASCEQAVTLDPKDSQSQAMWGAALYLNGRYPEAIAALKANLVENPEDLLSHFYLGMAYLRSQQYALANKSLETYQKISNSDNEDLAYLVSATGEGWTMREPVALEALQEDGKQLVERDVTWKVESSGELTRTLTVALKALKDEQPEETYQAAASLLSLAAFYLPRITPEVNGGALARAADAAGKPLFDSEIALNDMWLYFSGDLSSEGYADAIDFVLPAEGLRSPEMTDKLVQATAAEVTELRELEAKEPFTSKRLDQAGLDAYLEEAIDDEGKTEAHNDDLLLTMLGALEPQVDLWEREVALESEQILGFYDDEDKTFYVVSDKAPGLTDRTTLAHEYVHVLQDQVFAIGAARNEIDNDDQSIAYMALIEGDASLVTAQFMDEKLPALELMQTLEASAAEIDQEELERSPALLNAWMSFPYEQGAAFVAEVFSTGGWEAVNELYENPPVSTEQLLHPERYRAGEKPVDVPLPDLSQTLGGGWRVAHERNTLGELTWKLILAELVGPAGAEAAADGWGGDSYVLLQEGAEGPGAALLRTAWDTGEDAEEFWALVRVALATRTGFSEVVADLTGDGLTRTFAGPDACWIVQLDDDTVTLALGPTEEIAGKLFEAVSTASN